MIDADAWLAAWDEPDLEAIRSLSADNLEITAVTAAIEPRYYSGPDAAVRWLNDLQERIRAEWSATKLTHLGDEAVIIEGELRFADPGTTGADRQAFAILMHLAGEKVRWIGTFNRFEAARDAFDRGVGAPPSG